MVAAAKAPVAWASVAAVAKAAAALVLVRVEALGAAQDSGCHNHRNRFQTDTETTLSPFGHRHRSHHWPSRVDRSSGCCRRSQEASRAAPTAVGAAVADAATLGRVVAQVVVAVVRRRLADGQVRDGCGPARVGVHSMC